MNKSFIELWNLMPIYHRESLLRFAGRDTIYSRRRIEFIPKQIAEDLQRHYFNPDKINHTRGNLAQTFQDFMKETTQNAT